MNHFDIRVRPCLFCSKMNLIYGQFFYFTMFECLNFVFFIFMDLLQKLICSSSSQLIIFNWQGNQINILNSKKVFSAFSYNFNEITPRISSSVQTILKTNLMLLYMKKTQTHFVKRMIKKQIIKYKDQLLLDYIQKKEDKSHMSMHSISYYIYTAILCFLFISRAQCLLKTISIFLNQSSINQLSTHSWTLTYDTSSSRSSFSLAFPACVTISSLTTISVTGNTATVTGYSPTTINFTLGTPITSTTYIFSVLNVKNCFYSGSFKTYSVYNNFESLNQTNSGMTSVTYSPGAINNCQVVYDGYTGDISSSVQIKFGIKNNVTGTNFTVRFDYRSYSSSSYSITSYNALSSTPNFVAYCSLLVNGVQMYSAIPAFINFNELFIRCSFTINAANIITDQDIVSLKITNITNPKTIDSYGVATDFTIKIIDNNGFIYDRSLSCALSTVKLATYPSLFSQTQFINTNMYPLRVQSLNPIVLRLANGDRILIKYTLGTFSGCIGGLLVDNSDGQSAITFTQQVTTLNQAMLYSSSSGSTEFNNTISVQFLGCILTMPPSTYPIQFTFLFSTLNNQNVSSAYLQLNATLTPNYQIMTQAQVTLSMSVRTIGDTSSYTFSIKIKQPLSESPRITIQFPSQINVTNANATLATCGITVGTTGIGTKQCKLITSSTVQVDFHSDNPLPINTVINITILNVINPQNPSSISGFNIVTYYTSAQPQGIVEMGTNVTAPQSYSARIIYPVITNQNFTVYTIGTQFTVVYQTGVNLNNGSVSTFQFIDTSVKNIQFVSASTNMYLTPNIASPKFIFNFNTSIPSNSTINFVFSCLTPQKTGTYSILSIITTFNSLQYQKTSSSVTIQIVKPYTNMFAIAPAINSITGYTTEYAISFTTIVPHPTTTILQITFPSGTNLLNGLSNCSSGCTTTNITDTSSGSLDRIRVFLTPTTVTNGLFFSLRITSIVNQRFVGSTGNFSFTTLTTLGQLILTGTAVTTIDKPNILIATMEQADDYYRNNTNIVNMEINVTNMLQAGDYVKITFDSRSYTSNGVVGCIQGVCTFLQSGTILNVTVVLSSLQVMSSIIYLQIYGLISSSTTMYTDKFPINVETYSGQSFTLIDTGVMYYTLDCSSNDTVINKSCRTCATVSGKTNCTSCYTPTYNLINNDYCTNNCGNNSKYQTFPNSGICQSCVAPCFSCENQTFCINCIPGFYLMMDGSGQCLPNCSTNAGLYVFKLTPFLYCRFCTQPNCISCPNDVCDACASNWVLSSTFHCGDGCGNGYYESGGKCNLCDVSCVNCFGGGDSGCNACATGYFNNTGRCINKCPEGTVSLSNGVCGCDPVCKTCVDTSIKCLQCTSQFEFLYNYTCYPSCPQKTYSVGQICLDCSAGCLICSSTTCMQCVNGSYVFENRCYADCKTLGPRYNNMEIQGVIKCVQCPDGCTQCNSLYQCTACLSGYFLKDQSCKRECQITNTCNDVAKSDPIIPLPGLIAFGISSLILVALKLTVLKDIYLPYCLLFIGALVSYVQLVVTLAQTNNKINALAAANSTARLLAETSQIINQLLIALGLLALGLGLNYIMNIIFIVLFCKFLKPMIMKRQIDKISNYVVLALSLLSTYRFYLLSLSRLFKKPCLEVSSQDKLKQLHIFLAVSYIIDLEVFVGGILLIINSTKLSILYMLGIDLILIILFLWIIFIYVLVVPKSQDYYSLTKKFMFQDNHITEQASMQNQKQASKIKLGNGTDEKLHVEDYNDVQNIDDMPTKQQNVVKIAPKKSQNIFNQQMINSKTKRKQDQGRLSGSRYDNIYANEKNFGSHRSNRQDTQQQTKTNGKNTKMQLGSKSKRMKSQSVMQKSKNLNILPKEREQVQFQQNSQELQLQSQSQNNETKIQSATFEVNNFNKTNTNNKFRKQTKLKPNQRSSTIKIQQSKSMKKKKPFHTLESQIANQSNKDQDYDELDLQAIIQTKVVDRSKDKKVPRDTMTEADKNERGYTGQIYHEEISPSWFNIQNQRYDFEELDSQK